MRDVLGVMRVFLAVEVAPSATTGITKLQHHLEEAIGGRKVRWTSPNDLHITLKFLGDTSVSRTTQLLQGLPRTIGTAEPFMLTASGLGCFPNSRRPRLLWVGVGKDIDALERLQQGIERCAVDLGFAPARRRFHAHLTIGRIRSQLRQSQVYYLSQLTREVERQRFAEWRVKELVVVESKICSAGAQYIRWGRIPLLRDR